MTRANGLAAVLEGVTVQYRGDQRGATALRSLTVSLPAARVIGVVGPDGAGKTTLLRVLAGILSPVAGDVAVLGRRWSSDAATLKEKVAYMPQTGGAYDNLSVRENMELFATLYGLRGKERTDRLQRLLQITRLAPFQRRLARHLSGGMRQKLALACALLSNPELLLLDEPGVGVDVLSRRDMWEIYREAVARGTTVVLSTTYMDEAAATDFTVVLDAGQLLYAGPPQRFTEQAAGRVVRCQSSSLPARPLAARLAEVEGVLDAVVEGAEVRVLLKAPNQEVVRRLEEVGPCTAEPCEPRFGEAFALTLSERQASPPLPSLRLAATATQASDSEPAIEVRDVRKRFGRFEAVKGVSFTVRRGEIFGLLGANGAGKTTLFRMLCGVLRPTSGLVKVAGVDASRFPTNLRRRIGYMAQKFALYSELTPAENLWFYGRAYGMGRRQLRRQVPNLIETFGLKDYANERSGDLPLGFKQRLSLACAVVHDPETIFLDEPTSGVDPLARREFWQRINAFAAAGKTVLVTTHFMEEAEYCDRMVILDAGRTLAAGTPDEIRQEARRYDPTVRTLEDAYVALLTRGDESGRRIA